MKVETFEGSTETAYGKELETPVDFSGSYEAFETIEDVKSANEFPSDDEVLKFVNNKRKASARTSAQVAALKAAGHNPPNPNDPAVVKATMLKNIDKLDLPQDQKDMMKAVLQAN